MDATNGIFQSVLMSQTTITEPLRQIIDYNASTKECYMISDNGLIKFSSTGYETLKSFTVIPNIRYGFKDGNDIYLFSDIAGTNSSTTTKVYYKYDITTKTIADVTLNIQHDLNYIDNNGSIYLEDKTNKKIFKGTFAYPNITADATALLDYSSKAKAHNGIEIRGKVLRLFTSNVESAKTQADYENFNYIIKGSNAYIIEGLENSNTAIVSGAISTDSTENTWYITAFNNSTDISSNEVIVYSLTFDTVNNRFNATKKFGTGISSKDRDIVIGKKGTSYYFHLAGRAPLFHFTDGSTTISQTIVNNLSSSIDFVYITPDPAGDIVATSNKGFYRLTNPSSPTGFVRINSL